MTVNTRSLSRDDLPRHLTELYHAYSFTGTDTGFAFAYDTLADWRDVTQYAIGRATELVRTLPDSRLRAQEHEFLTKMAVCWRQRGQGTLFTPDPSTLGNTQRGQADMLRAELRTRSREYLEALSAMTLADVTALVQHGKVVLDRGKGAPYWSPGTDKAVTLAYARLAQGSRSFEELQRRIMGAANARLPFCQSSLIRIQGNRKPTPEYGVVSGQLTQIGERTGPKVRRVGAQPFAVNHLWAGVGNLLRTLMASLDDYNTGTIGPAQQAASYYTYGAALDLASFDTTVSLELLDAVRDLLLEPVLSWLVAHDILEPEFAALLLDCDYHTQLMPVLMPPRHMGEAAYLAFVSGQTRSGENLTSWKGTEINRARVRAKAKHLGVTADARIYNYGDDTVLFTNRAAVIDAWAALTDFGGFNETIAPDVTFLMRRLPEGHTYFGRMLAASINREQRTEPTTQLAAAAAFGTRRALLTGHPLTLDYLPLLSGYERNDRLSTAAKIAINSPDAVALNMAAATEASALYGHVAGLEQELESLQRLVGRRVPGADAAVAALDTALLADKRVARWGDFQAAASALTYREAERTLLQRSYTIPHI